MSTLRRRMMMVAREHGVPNDEIWYYAAEKVKLYNSTGVVSHDFANGKGVIKFSSNVTEVGEQLRGTGITNVELPSGVTSIGNSAFRSCPSLALTSLPSGVTSIGFYAFYSCINIQSLIIPIATPPTLSTNVFDGTTFPIYVPSESVEAYKSAVNWSSYKSRIFPIS